LPLLLWLLAARKNQKPLHLRPHQLPPHPHQLLTHLLQLLPHLHPPLTLLPLPLLLPPRLLPLRPALRSNFFSESKSRREAAFFLPVCFSGVPAACRQM